MTSSAYALHPPAVHNSQPFPSSSAVHQMCIRDSAYRAENLRNIDTVHDGGKHTDLIRFGTINIFTGTTSPEIASADDDSYLNAIVYQFFYL